MRHNSKRKGKMMWASKAKEPGLTVDGYWSEHTRRNTGECWVHPLASLNMCIKKNSKFTFKRPPQTTVPSIRQLLQRLWDTGLHAKMKTNYLTHILKRQLGKLYFLYFWRLNIFNFPTSQILFSGILRQSQKKQVSMRDLFYKIHTFFEVMIIMYTYTPEFY